MKCNYHNKELEHTCTWCGRAICELCVAKKDGKKVYCHKCHERLKDIKRERVIARKPEPPKLDDGYLVLGER